MTRLWLIRHGETDWNLEGRYQGQANPPLNARGREQARGLAWQLAGTEFEAIYSSDLQRAHDTACILGESLGLTITVDKRLREINQGVWEGMVVSEIKTCYPADWAIREWDPLWARPPEGESLIEVAARMLAAAGDIARTHPTGSVLIISHGLALAGLICLSRAWPLSLAYKVTPGHVHPEVIVWPLPATRRQADD